jgi:hypothetical protein
MGALHCRSDDSRKAKVSGELCALYDDIDEYAIKGNLVGPILVGRQIRPYVRATSAMIAPDV